jgi:hypothetical protein
MVDELHHSHAAGDVCCERCHADASGPMSALARSYRPPSASSTPKPSEREQLVSDVWKALERVGNVSSLADGSGKLVGYCPACGRGTVAVRVLASPTRLRLDACSDGCAAELIAKHFA